MAEFALTRDPKFLDESASAGRDAIPELDRLVARLAASREGLPGLVELRIRLGGSSRPSSGFTNLSQQYPELDAPEVLDATGAVTQALDDLRQDGQRLLAAEERLDDARDVAFQRR